MQKCARLLIFIKPWDDDVFINLLKLLKFIEKMEKHSGISIEIVMPEDLLGHVNAAVYSQNLEA